MAEHSAEFSLHVTYPPDPVSATVAVSGEIDMLTAPALTGVLTALIDAGRPHLVIDLARCWFVDGRGSAVFAHAAHRVGAVGGSVTIISVSAATRRLFDLCEVSELFRLMYAESTDLVRSGSMDGGGGAPSYPASGEALRAADVLSLVRSDTDIIDAALRLVTALAGVTVANADGVSVTLERHGRLTTVAASNDKVLTMDRHQYQTGEGPCLDAKAQDRWFYIESLAEESRWPTFVPLALDQGINSILSSPLRTDDRAQGALNIYSSTARAFGRREQRLAALFADQASQILTTAGSDSTDGYSRRFGEALRARQRVHQAQGIMMARDGVSADDAMASLYRSARAADMTVMANVSDVIASLVPDGGSE